MSEPIILLTGFEPFGGHRRNPSEEVVKALDGRRIGAAVVRGAILPVHHDEAWARFEPLLHDVAPRGILHVGLAGGRARIALERVALNVMDYEIADNAGFQARGEPCVAGGPAAYFSTLPLPAMRDALVADGIPACISHTAGTFLCNQMLYRTLHALA
ncbi:MAG: pyroglutamyl-peptidase I, partial [Candidatus Rokubacteria bacterium]|nr:pyroglutamyl-peptidase I [Candidatus Rokubacteria bacterium]